MSFETFTDGLKDITVTGVKVVYEGMPRSIPTSNLPAMWVGLPDGAEGAVTFAGEGLWSNMTAEVWIPVEAIEQGTQPQNYEATITIIDSLTLALRAISSASISKTKLAWTIRGVIAPVGEVLYWTVIARVTGSG